MSASRKRLIQAPAPTTDLADPRTQRWSLGLTLIHDFISEAEESSLIAAFQAMRPPSPPPSASQMSRRPKPIRSSQHFGHRFNYTTFGADSFVSAPVPDYISALMLRLPRHVNSESGKLEPLPEQFTAQHYPPGTGIPPHVDTHSLFGEALYNLSYGSAVPMSFRKCNAGDARRMRMPKRSLGGGTTSASPPSVQVMELEEEDVWEIMLPRRSLMIMTGEARYGYVHGIRPRKTDKVDGKRVPRVDRYSLTMRALRIGDEVGCRCKWPGVCDARVREEEDVIARLGVKSVGEEAADSACAAATYGLQGS